MHKNRQFCQPHEMSYQSLSLPVVAVLFISELVNAKKKELKEKKTKKGRKKKEKSYFHIIYQEDTLQGGNMYWQMDGVGFVSFTGNLQVA